MLLVLKSQHMLFLCVLRCIDEASRFKMICEPNILNDWFRFYSIFKNCIQGKKSATNHIGHLGGEIGCVTLSSKVGGKFQDRDL